MNNQWKQIFVSALLIAAGVLGAENNSESEESFEGIEWLQELEGELRLPVGNRPLSEEERFSMQEKRSLLDDENDCISKGNTITSHPGAFYHPVAILNGGDLITLQDGSVWRVHYKDKSVTLDWLSGDTIVIQPNHSWFSSYQFVFLNKHTEAKIRVNLLLRPIYNGIHTHWIVAIDYLNNELCLEDGSFWKISSSDSSILKKWLVTDTIMIGINDSWFSSKPNILINVENLTYAEAICEN